MNKDTLNIVFLHLNIDEYYKIIDVFKLSVVYYCKNVEVITKGSLTWADYIKNDEKNQMDYESLYGYLDVVKYLHNIKKDCTKYAINNASENGHLEIVKLLHQIGYVSELNPIFEASLNNHLDVVKYLYETHHYHTKDAMDHACHYGHLEVV